MLGAVLVASPARAQTSDKALAEGLFADARALMAEHRHAEACAKFASSHRLEPKLGTLLNLAACHEAEGRTASAWAEFTEAKAWAERVGEADRVDYARDHVARLATALPRIVLHAAHPPPDLEIAVDDVRVPGAALGTELPVDPGPRRIAVSSPGRTSWTTTLDIHAGASMTSVDVPDLAVVEALAPAASVVVGPTPAPPVAEPSSWQRPLAWGAIATGAVAAGVGTYFGIATLNTKADAQRECNGSACTQLGLDRFDTAARDATASTIAFGVAIAGVAIGVVLLVLDAPASTAQGLASRRVAW